MLTENTSMNKSIQIITKTIILLLFLIACSDDSNPVTTFETELFVTLNNSEIYEFHTGIGGDEESARITVQAKYFERSELLRDADTKWEAVYYYKPQKEYSGFDYVELETQTGSDGASPPTETKVIKITIKIIE